MAAIALRGVSYAYPGTTADVFDRVDLTLDSHWRTGIVGRNGRGKTTLLRLLAGQIRADEGELTLPLAGRYFPQWPRDTGADVLSVVRDAAGPYAELAREMRALEGKTDAAGLLRYGVVTEEFERLGGYTIDGRIAAEFAALGLDTRLLARAFATLSGGEQTRALIAALFLRADSFALIDEPTDHLDRDGRAQLAAYLRGKPGFLLASHDRQLLDDVADHLLVFTRTEMAVRRGGYSAWRAERDDRGRREQADKARLGREIDVLERAAQQRREGALTREADKAPHTDKGYIGHRAAKQMKRALHIEQRAGASIALRREQLRDFDKQRELRIHTTTNAGTLVRCTDVAIAVTTSSYTPADAPAYTRAHTQADTQMEARTLARHLTFEISARQRICVGGANGCGKTTMLEVVAGLRAPQHGVRQCKPGLRIALAAQQPRWPDATLRGLAAREHLDETRLRQILGVLQVSAADLDRPLATLSAGQRKKVALACSLVVPADLLIWDEPLNYLDIESREDIERAILGDTPTLLFVEHDRRFVEAVATHHLRLDGARPELTRV